MEIQEMNENNRVPMLDIEVWREEDEQGKQRVKHGFFEKKATTKKVIHKKSAVPEKTKVTTLVKEVLRRMKNSCKEMEVEERAEIINKFNRKMVRSGYEEEQRKNIILDGLAGYYRGREREERGGRRLNRHREEGRRMREVKKIVGPKNWYKGKITEIDKENTNKEITNEQTWRRKKIENKRRGKKRDKEVEYESIMFVPATPKAELKNELQKAEDEISRLFNIPKIKIEERSGQKISLQLMKRWWNQMACTREDCWPCKSAEKGSERGKCMKESVTYKVECLKCREKNVKSIYQGETSKSGYERGAQHEKDYQDMKEDNHMTKHAIEHHIEEIEKPQFKMTIMKNYKKAIERQIAEAVNIEMTEADIIMNSRSEWNGSRLPRVIIGVGNKNNDSDYKGRREGHKMIENQDGTRKRRKETVKNTGWTNRNEEEKREIKKRRINNNEENFMEKEDQHNKSEKEIEDWLKKMRKESEIEEQSRKRKREDEQATEEAELSNEEKNKTKDRECEKRRRKREFIEKMEKKKRERQMQTEAERRDTEEWSNGTKSEAPIMSESNETFRQSLTENHYQLQDPEKRTELSNEIKNDKEYDQEQEWNEGQRIDKGEEMQEPRTEKNQEQDQNDDKRKQEQTDLKMMKTEMTLKIHQKTVTLKSKEPGKINRMRKGKGLVKTVKLRGNYHSIIEMFEKKKDKTELSKGQVQGDKENVELSKLGFDLKGLKNSQDQTTMKSESYRQDTDKDEIKRQEQVEREGEDNGRPPERETR